MITAQEIREKTLGTSFNGYNRDQVDEFLEQIAADVAAMAKENAALKSKMRVLVEKVEEYRQTEDSMRLALMSAQKMGTQIESDAQARADAIIAEARDTADRMSRRAADNIANEEAKLAEAKKATDRFFEHMRLVCEKQVQFYEKLSKMRLVGGDDQPKAAEEQQPPQEEPAAEEPVEEAPAEPAVSAKEAAVEETVRSIETSAEKAALDEPEAMEVDTDIPDEEEEPTRRFGDELPPKKKRTFDEFRFDDDI